MCWFNLIAKQVSLAHRTGENERKKYNDNIKKSIQTPLVLMMTFKSLENEIF